MASSPVAASADSAAMFAVAEAMVTRARATLAGFDARWDVVGSDFDEASEVFLGGGEHAYAGIRWRAAGPVDEQVVATGGVCAFVGDDRRDLVVGEEVVADSPGPVADGKVIELKQYRAEAEPASRT